MFNSKDKSFSETKIYGWLGKILQPFSITCFIVLSIFLCLIYFPSYLEASNFLNNRYYGNLWKGLVFLFFWTLPVFGSPVDNDFYSTSDVGTVSSVAIWIVPFALQTEMWILIRNIPLDFMMTRLKSFDLNVKENSLLNETT